MNASTAALRHTLHVEPRRVRIERERDTGHIIRGIGFVSECSCGWESPRNSSYHGAMFAGRQHAAEHASQSARERER